MISGKTKVCGILANPVEHSLSPLMQNFYAEKTGVDFAYVPLKVEPDRVEDAIRGAYALNLVGMNVTVPYKQQVMAYLKEMDEDAKAIGAVNTLVRVEGGYKGYNTDAAGFLQALVDAKIQINGKACILLGAGGASKAAAYMLAKEGASCVYLLNRNVERAKALAALVNRLSGREVMIPMALEEYPSIPEGSYLAVQSTSVGMHPNCDDILIEDDDFYRKIHTGIDLVYTPMETQFMRRITALGGRAVGGLSMLLYQGIIAYELWNPGVTIEKTLIEEAKKLMQAQLGR